ncbi:hypothetical protein B0T26DRAFT_769906 [Lasiosphaeria miniovina]|uniref:Zn(2)-C6 fungal-type domain-containing protein n=1 Tax=Lasiosphaeria miniovina TaxID=1954250 RepID=A0AA40ATX8_9PEZI|nr:uncharacterized protein B0T26DRAFT_769906 [Lasiosphaeria miniovina]KAK0721916.1 hypothetical protein B0T26DRAFT_769906 [Lasiosphaeria miniovina]
MPPLSQASSRSQRPLAIRSSAMPSCMRCREKSLTCRAPPNAKRCAECTRAGNMRCGLDGPDSNPRLLGAGAPARQRAAFQAKIAKIFSHEDAAIAELEEEERLETLAAPEAAPPVSPFSIDWGAADIDQALAFGSPDPLTPLPSGQV